MSKPPQPMKNWGDLNIALNGLVRERVIAGYKTNRADKASEPSIEVSVEPGADQAMIVSQVRALLTGAFADASVRTRQG